jgi:hypothetical protein
MSHKKVGRPRLAVLAGLILLASTHAQPVHGKDSADRISIFATQPGEKSIDVDGAGGNPFATALLQLLALNQPDLALVLAEIGPLTNTRSFGLQTPEVVGSPGKRHVLAGAGAADPRIALVIGYSDYSRTTAPSLPGVAHDVERVDVALRSRGFDVTGLLNPSPTELARRLRTFAHRSTSAEIAVVYATGHGVQFGQRAYLLPGNHVRADTPASIAQTSIAVSSLAASLKSKGLNLLLYGACRDDPFAEAKVDKGKPTVAPDQIVQPEQRIDGSWWRRTRGR